jgi:hypothetical protein
LWSIHPLIYSGRKKPCLMKKQNSVICEPISYPISLHSSGTKVQQTTDTGKGQTHPPPTVRVHDLTLNTHLEIRRDLCVALCFGSGSAGGGESRVEGSGGQHLRRRVDEIHWLHDFAVEFGKVDAGDAVVGVGVDAVCLWCLLVLWSGKHDMESDGRTFIFSVVL